MPRQLIVHIAILVMTITMIVTEPTKKPVQCLHEWSECGLLSKSCCHKKIKNSSIVINRYCDYLGSRFCVTPDKMFRFKDSRLIEELKDNEDFQEDFNNYVKALEKIERHLDLKHFMNRMFSTEPVEEMSTFNRLY